MVEILEAQKINGCRALPLAVEGWCEILKDGHGGDAVCLSWNQSVLWIEDGSVPVAVMVWEFQDYRSEVWISLSYVKPEFRGRGYFRSLYDRIVEIAQEKKALKISGGINANNSSMRAAAEKCGRSADYIVYSQSIATAS